MTYPTKREVIETLQGDAPSSDADEIESSSTCRCAWQGREIYEEDSNG